MYAPLQAARVCVFADINLPGAKKLAPFQVQTEDLAKTGPICAQPDRRNKHFGTLAQICKITTKPGESNFVVASHWRVELQRPVALQMQAFGVVGTEEEERRVLGFCVAGKGQGQLLRRMNMELGLVCSRAHDPVAIFADSDAVAGYSTRVRIRLSNQIGQKAQSDLPSSNSNS
jgi:hypothetical protein